MSVFPLSAIKRLSLRPLLTGLIPLFVLAHFGHHLLTALPVPLLPMIRADFALDYTRSGIVVSAFNLAYGIGQVPAGWITDRIGARLVITFGICGVAIAGALVGLAPTYLVLVILMALMGVMGGGYHPAAPPIISASVEPKKRGQALGLHIIGGSSSYFLAPIMAAGIATVWGWRGAFVVLAIPTIVFGIAFYIALGRVTGKKRAAAATAQAEALSEPGRWRRLVIFIILSTFTQAVMFSVLAFIPLYLVDHFGVSKEAAAAFMSLYYVSGLWASPMGGYLSDRVGTIPLILTVLFIAGPVVYLFNLAPYGVAFGTLMVLLGVVGYVRMPVSEAYIIGHTSAHNRSTILGIYYFSSMEGGGVLTPVAGYFIDQFGFYPTFTVAGAIILLVTAICSIWLWGRRD